MKNNDGIFKDWGERLNYGKVNPRKGKNIAGGKIDRTPPPQKVFGRGDFVSTIKKSPEVMVKISGGGKDMAGIKAHFDYISRNGKLEVENEQGNIYQGKSDVKELRDDWRGASIPKENGKKREAFNIVLSMPPGTDRPSVKNAAREFAKELFSNHQYVFAEHDDEKHPHVHLVVKAVDRDGIRMNPRKRDLQNWRQTFAEKLRDYGIDANATPRAIRGVVKKQEKQVIKNINKEFKQAKRGQKAYTTQQQEGQAKQEVETGIKRNNPAEAKIKQTRGEIQKSYGAIAKELAMGSDEDKKLAVEVVKFVKSMAPLTTKHQSRVNDMEALKNKAVTKEASKSISNDKER